MLVSLISRCPVSDISKFKKSFIISIISSEMFKLSYPVTTMSYFPPQCTCMAQKIAFQVVYATGSDDDYSSSTLENHGPSVRGWRSERFCVYPQEIVLQLPAPIRVRKLQLLSHQYLVARKVELFVGRCRSGAAPSYQGASFSRLGYISFDPNDKTGYKARELKSVHLDCEGSYIKIVCQKNHVNKHNIFNQVGIVAVNILGEFLSNTVKPDSYRDLGLPVDPSDSIVMGNINRREVGSLIDDITFGMYQDPEVGRVIKQLERAKLAAIDEERYGYAKRLKQAIGDLHKVGERLGRLEKEKKAAVAEENYDVAQAKKVQANEIRMVVFEQLDIPALLQTDRLQTDERTDLLVRSPPHQLPTLQHEPPPPQPTHQPARQPAHQPAHQPARQPHLQEIPVSAPPPLSVSRASDRPIPTLANKPQQPTEEGNEEEAPVSARDTTDPDKPDEAAMKAAHDLTQAVELFGHENVARLFCKQFAMRDKGISEICKVVEDLQTDSPEYSTRALVQVFKQGFTDPVFNTLTLTLDTFKSLISRNVLAKNHTIELCKETLPVLLKRIGENVRLRDTITGTFVAISSSPHLLSTHCIPNLTVSLCKEKNPKVLTARLMLLEKMLEVSGISESSYSEERVMKFVAPTLSNNARDVRDTAIRITLLMYKECGNTIRKFLPRDDPVIRKKQLIWKKIFESFDEMDGKPVRKPNEPTAEEKKAQQVAALKAELAQLRAMAQDANIEVPEELKPGNEHMKMKGGRKKKKQGPAGKPGPKQGAGGAAAEPEVDEDTLDKTCMFCNEHNDKFNAETLDVHFWRSCPMLSRCSHCSQVVEIAGTTTHLLTECSAQDQFEPCDSCGLAREVDGGAHTCATTVPAEGETVCPLCDSAVRDGEEGWRDHLMGPSGCRKNPRRAKK